MRREVVNLKMQEDNGDKEEKVKPCPRSQEVAYPCRYVKRPNPPFLESLHMILIKGRKDVTQWNSEESSDVQLAITNRVKLLEEVSKVRTASNNMDAIRALYTHCGGTLFTIKPTFETKYKQLLSPIEFTHLFPYHPYMFGTLFTREYSANPMRHLIFEPRNFKVENIYTHLFLSTVYRSHQMGLFQKEPVQLWVQKSKEQ